MAKQTLVTLVDDIDGSKASVTVAFAWDGKSYEIDLSKRNAAAFENAITPYVKAARRAGPTPGSTRHRGTSTRRARDARSQSATVREWARANGYPDLADRGRIPAEVQAAYAGAN
jgi:hypothetical protein